MNGGNKVLACVDRSIYSGFVAEAAAWVARALDAELELLHVLDRHPEEGRSSDHSGAIGFNAQESLLNELAQADQIRIESMRTAGRVFLGELREKAYAAGVAQVDIRQRHGELLETIQEQEADIGLLVLGRRGESADATQRDLGRNVERVLRSLSKPILTVTDRFRQPERALVAFDGSAAARKSIEMLCRRPLLKEVEILLVMVGEVSRKAAPALEWAHARLGEAGLRVQKRHVAGDPETVIARMIQDDSIDLLTMGAYSHSPIRALLFGSRTNELLRAARVPTLLVR